MNKHRKLFCIVSFKYLLKLLENMFTDSLLFSALDVLFSVFSGMVL